MCVCLCQPASQPGSQPASQPATQSLEPDVKPSDCRLMQRTQEVLVSSVSEGQRIRSSSLLLLSCFNLYTLQCECYEGAAMKAMDARAAKAKAATPVQGAAMKAKGRRACQGGSLWMHPCSASWPGPMPSLACRATAPLLSYVWATASRGTAHVRIACVPARVT